jgi:hypothetical protein
MDLLYRVWTGMTKPIKCIALGNPAAKQKGASSDARPSRKYL